MGLGFRVRVRVRVRVRFEGIKGGRRGMASLSTRKPKCEQYNLFQDTK